MRGSHFPEVKVWLRFYYRVRALGSLPRLPVRGDDGEEQHEELAAGVGIEEKKPKSQQRGCLVLRSGKQEVCGEIERLRGEW